MKNKSILLKLVIYSLIICAVTGILGGLLMKGHGDFNNIGGGALVVISSVAGVVTILSFIAYLIKLVREN